MFEGWAIVQSLTYVVRRPPSSSYRTYGTYDVPHLENRRRSPKVDGRTDVRTYVRTYQGMRGWTQARMLLLLAVQARFPRQSSYVLNLGRHTYGIRTVRRRRRTTNDVRQTLNDRPPLKQRPYTLQTFTHTISNNLQHTDLFRLKQSSGKMCPTFPDFYRSGTLRDAPKTLGDALEWSGIIPKRREMSGNVRTCPKMSENGPKMVRKRPKTLRKRSENRL